MFKLNKKGFTLIELLVVIAIIAVLASIVLVSLNTARVKGRDARRVADLKQVQNALNAYIEDKPTIGFPTGADVNALAAALKPVYLPAIPVDPSTGNSYKYAYCASGGKQIAYHLGAIMEQPAGLLVNDSAQDSSAVGGIDGVCPGAAMTNGFKGESDDCAAGTGTEKCYDIIGK